MLSTVKKYLELVRFSHTIFALPFAIAAALIAVHLGGDNAFELSLHAPLPGMKPVVGILLCMVSARTAAMAFNRLVDRAIDAANPRTSSRHLPRGDLHAGEVLLLIVLAFCVFIGSTMFFLPNWLPLVLSLPVLAWLLGYSYAKRFTMFAHVWLGTALGLTPIAAWIAIRGGIVVSDPVDLLPSLLLGLAVTAWVAGFDIIYACQDAHFDATHGLQSIPARLGVQQALRLSAWLHAVMLVVLALMPLVVPDLGGLYGLTLLAIGLLLAWEHSIVRTDDLSRINEAFFKANAVLGVLMMTGIMADLWLL